MTDPNTEFDLKLTAAAVNTILAALAETPYRVAAPVIDTIRRQIVAVDPTAFDPPQPAAANGAAHVSD